ncbi:helix-turn-helix domain-containing protein [Streptomyces sp. NPDC002817]|uniref:XRE family transcriptional regulator n=1 Tax=Streptomyces sp. NPDC088357 TaxID=3154655 RepID=UPI00342B4122
MAAVVQWTGREAALLGEAHRLSIRAYAQILGVDPKTVSRWRKLGSDTEVVPETAEILDRFKETCPPAVLEVFYASLNNGVAGETGSAPALGPATVVSHKFLPVYIGDAVSQISGDPREHGPARLSHRARPALHPDAEATSRLHLYDCGVAIFHLVQRRTVETLGDLAVWRYRSYLEDLEWADKRIHALLAEVADQSWELKPPAYVLSAYLLEDSSWQGANLETAMQLLTTPSVLVDRQRPKDTVRLGDDVEQALFSQGFEHSDVVGFSSQAIAVGFAGWSGVAYHPLSPERALSMDAIVALELDVQALWCLSSYVLDEIEEGRDPVMPKDYGWRFLRGALTRLTAARPQETAQHQLMREAVLTTSQLPDRLRTAQEVLRDSDI